MDSHKLHLVILAVLVSVVGPTRGAEQELLFPIMTHVGNYSSRMVLLNPSKYSVRYRISARRSSGGGVSLNSTMDPNSMKGYRPDGDINPIDFTDGWGSLQYRYLEVPDADQERVKNLRLLAWTELTLLKRRGRTGDPANPVISVASIPAVEAALEFRVPGILQRDEEAAIAILNPSEEPVQIEVTLYRYRTPVRNPSYIQVINMPSVPPMERLIRFLAELMTEGKDDPLELPLPPYQSTLHIRGSAPIAVGALLYNHGTGVFGNLPVVRVD